VKKKDITVSGGRIWHPSIATKKSSELKNILKELAMSLAVTGAAIVMAILIVTFPI